jgi:hypothetical protein
MSLLTNGFMSNCGRLFGQSEQFEADIVRVGAERILCERTRESMSQEMNQGLGNGPYTAKRKVYREALLSRPRASLPMIMPSGHLSDWLPGQKSLLRGSSNVGKSKKRPNKTRKFKSSLSWMKESSRIFRQIANRRFCFS